MELIVFIPLGLLIEPDMAQLVPLQHFALEARIDDFVDNILQELVLLALLLQGHEHHTCVLFRSEVLEPVKFDKQPAIYSSLGHHLFYHGLQTLHDLPADLDLHLILQRQHQNRKMEDLRPKEDAIDHRFIIILRFHVVSPLSVGILDFIGVHHGQRNEVRIGPLMRFLVVLLVIFELLFVLVLAHAVLVWQVEFRLFGLPNDVIALHY